MKMISCKNLTASYDGVAALANVTFEINKGDRLCIIGQNGSGKSTLLKILLGLKRQDRGFVVYEKGLSKKDIGYLPQLSAARKDFPASVMEIVLSGCLGSIGVKPFYSCREKERAVESLTVMSAESLKDRPFSKLSGGQQQRVLLARAFCASRKMLFLDEPVAGLDPSITSDFYSIVSDISNDDLTIIMVSHDFKNAIGFSTHILHLDCRQLFFGTTQEYCESVLYTTYSRNFNDV